MDDLQSMFEGVRMAWRGRLLFRSDAEYRRATGVTLDTVGKNRMSAVALRSYWHALDEASLRACDSSLEDLLTLYTVTSKFYLASDWGEMRDIRARRLFCRLAFRLYATAGMELSADELVRFRLTDPDTERLLGLLFPDGPAEAPAADVCFLLLFAFGVVEPWREGNSRWRDLEEADTVDALASMERLTELIRDDIPRMGSAEKPAVVEEILAHLGKVAERPEEFAEQVPAKFAQYLHEIARLCRTVATPTRLREETQRFGGLSMPGIWVDDADIGSTRFWVFPENLLFAFCYRQAADGWELLPYEMVWTASENPEYYDSMMLISPTGGRGFLLSWESAIPASEIFAGGCDVTEVKEGKASAVRVVDTKGPFPAWLDWREWRRLSADDARHARFGEVLRRLYAPREGEDRLRLRNVAPEQSDFVNCVVGRDSKYVYIYDWDIRDYRLRFLKGEVCFYEPEVSEEKFGAALFELPLSEAHPLYAVPLRVAARRDLGVEATRFMEVLRDGAEIDEARIVRREDGGTPRLVLPAFSRAVDLDMGELGKLGVLRLTSWTGAR